MADNSTGADDQGTGRFVIRGARGIPKTYVAMKMRDGDGQEPALVHDDIPNIFMGKIQIQPDKCSKCGKDLGDGENVEVVEVDGQVLASHKECPK